MVGDRVRYTGALVEVASIKGVDTRHVVPVRDKIDLVVMPPQEPCPMCDFLALEGHLDRSRNHRQEVEFRSGERVHSGHWSGSLERSPEGSASELRSP
jgi:hypothetical protein